MSRAVTPLHRHVVPDVGRSPPGQEQDGNARQQDGDAGQGPPTRIDQARVKHVQAEGAEQQGRDRIQGDPERTGGVRIPTPQDAAGIDPVLVGRVREDLSEPGSLELWITGDNLRKGAALNAVQMAEILVGRA